MFSDVAVYNFQDHNNTYSRNKMTSNYLLNNAVSATKVLF